MPINTSLSSLSFSRIYNSQGSVYYPSPFFDVASTYLPRTLKHLFQWCRFYFYSNPVIHAGIVKIATYPLNDLEYEDDRDSLVKVWRDIFENVLHIRQFMYATAVSYQLFGNALVSIIFPFRKVIKCGRCGRDQPLSLADYRFDNFSFHLRRCIHCGAETKDAEVHDVYTTELSRVKLVLWNLEDVRVEHNPITDVSDYYVKLPKKMLNDIKLGNKRLLEGTPQIFIDAARENRQILLNSDRVFHLRRVVLPGELEGWGVPRILPVLKQVFLMHVEMKAQEMIAMEHAVPLRVVYPAPVGDAITSPFTTLNLREWKDNVLEELVRWRRDPNYIPITTLPLGYQELGGKGRALLLGPEIRAAAEMVLAGMNIPPELVFGGLSWSGSNVSLRMLENSIINDVKTYNQFLRWVMESVAVYFGIPAIKVKFRRFKMADDLQRLALNLQMYEAGLVSQHTVLSQADLDPAKERDHILDEAEQKRKATTEALVAQARAQGEAQKVAYEYQVKLQQQQLEAQAKLQQQLQQQQLQQQLQAQQQGQVEPPPPTEKQQADQLRMSPAPEQQQPQQGDPVQQLADNIASQDKDVARQLLLWLKSQNPDLYQRVLQLLEQRASSAGAGPQPEGPQPEGPPPEGPQPGGPLPGGPGSPPEPQPQTPGSPTRVPPEQQKSAESGATTVPHPGVGFLENSSDWESQKSAGFTPAGTDFQAQLRQVEQQAQQAAAKASEEAKKVVSTLAPAGQIHPGLRPHPALDERVPPPVGAPSQATSQAPSQPSSQGPSQGVNPKAATPQTGGGGGSPGVKVETRPLPEIKPPRRKGETI